MASALSWHSPSKEKKLLDNASLQTLPVGYHCSTHLHRTMELFICLQGKLTFSVLNLTQTIQPGEYVVIFSNTPHSAAVCEEDCTLLQPVCPLPPLYPGNYPWKAEILQGAEHGISPILR